MTHLKIGGIGSGNIGATAGRLFAAAGHEVGISNSRGPESLSTLVAEIGPNARAMTVGEAAKLGRSCSRPSRSVATRRLRPAA